MIHISIRTTGIDSRTFYQCPKCFSRATYFVSVPTNCTNCNHPLPNLKLMEKNQVTRYNYYKFGNY